MKNLSHCQVVRSLCDHLSGSDKVVFSEPLLGPSGSPMPDALRIQKSFTRTDITAYEAKASRSDLMQDVKKLKWESYLEVCDRFYFAIGNAFEYKDLIEHLPVGIIKRGANGWTTPRAAPRNPHRKPLPERISLALIMHQANHHHQGVSRVARLEAEKEILLVGEIKNLYSLRNSKLRERLQKVQQKEALVSYELEKQRKVVISELFTKLGMSSLWYQEEKFVERLVDELIARPCTKALLDGIKRLTDVVAKEATSRELGF